MKKLVLMFLLALPLWVSAAPQEAGSAPQGTADAVELVQYEQSWLDPEATLALKNNTSETITSVTYRIKYLNMNGQALDYEEYTSNVEIIPGMTRKVNIPAYEHHRYYSYYKSEASYSGQKFKIEFQLVSYDKEPDPDSVAAEGSKGIFSGLGNSKKASGGHASFALDTTSIVLLIFCTTGLFVLVAIVAKGRNRSAAAWVLASLFITPLLALIILLFIGKRYDPQADARNNPPR